MSKQLKEHEEVMDKIKSFYEKDKIFKSNYSDFKIEVNKYGFITINNKEDDDSIFLGEVNGTRCKLIKEAFDYAGKLKDGK